MVKLRFSAVRPATLEKLVENFNFATLQLNDVHKDYRLSWDLGTSAEGTEGDRETAKFHEQYFAANLRELGEQLTSLAQNCFMMEGMARNHSE